MDLVHLYSKVDAGQVKALLLAEAVLQALHLLSSVSFSRACMIV